MRSKVIDQGSGWARVVRIDGDGCVHLIDIDGDDVDYITLRPEHWEAIKKFVAGGK
jgi:hypothetical protein